MDLPWRREYERGDAVISLSDVFSNGTAGKRQGCLQFERFLTIRGTLPLNDYNLIDLIARIRLNLRVPLTGRINFVRNTAVDEGTLSPIIPGSGNQGYR